MLITIFYTNFLYYRKLRCFLQNLYFSLTSLIRVTTMSVTNAGDLLKTSHPYVHVIANTERERRCEECLQLSKLQRCSACHIARYCSARCQKKAWKFHKLECPCFKRVSPKLPKDSVLLYFRLILRYKWGDNTKITTEYLGKNRCFEDLMSHEDDIKTDHRRLDEFLELCHTVHLFAGDDFELPASSVLLNMFGKMVINSFTISNGEMQPIGTGLYLGPSVLDHSCQSDAVVVFNGVDLQLRATQNIPALCVEQLFISYIDMMATSGERQRQLDRDYYFTCQCALCDDEDRDMEMTATSCPSDNCKEPIFENADGKFLPCESCKRTNFPKDYEDQKTNAVSEAKEILEKCKKWKAEGDAESVFTACNKFLMSHGAVLHDQNIYHVQIVDRLFDACIDLTKWDFALKYGVMNIPAYKKFYLDNHPNVGIHFMKIGKIQLFQQKLKDALISLQQAETILRVTHGKDHSLFQDLVTLLNQCEEELRLELEATTLNDDN